MENPPTEPTPLPNPHYHAPAPPGQRNPWPIAIAMMVTLLTVIVAITVVMLKVITAATRLVEVPAEVAAMPAKVIHELAGAFRPRFSVRTVLSNTIGELHSHPKLVVLTTQINAEVNKASTTTWAGLNFGTTEVSVRAYGNRVQYYVPLDTLGTSNFVFDAPNKKLIVSVPAPRLDEELVDVQSNPALIDVETHNGWAKLDRYSGAPLREDARRDLRPAVIAAGRQALLQQKARQSGEKVLRELLQPLADALNPDVTLDIEFQPAP